MRAQTYTLFNKADALCDLARTEDGAIGSLRRRSGETPYFAVSI